MRLTVLFILLGFVFAILGFGNIIGDFALLAKLGFVIFIILFAGRLYKAITEC